MGVKVEIHEKHNRKHWLCIYVLDSVLGAFHVWDNEETCYLFISKETEQQRCYVIFLRSCLYKWCMANLNVWLKSLPFINKSIVILAAKDLLKYMIKKRKTLKTSSCRMKIYCYSCPCVDLGELIIFRLWWLQ